MTAHLAIAALVTGALRSGLLLGASLCAAALLRRARPALRRLVLVAGLGAALLSPLAGWLRPMRIPAPGALGVLAEPFAEPSDARPPSSGPPSTTAAGRAPVARSTSADVDGCDALVALWAVVAAALLTRTAVGLARARSIARRATRPPVAEWQSAVAHAERATRARADLLVSAEVDAPAVTGILRPSILLPPTSSTWSEARRRAVLLHELSHVARHDCLAQLVADLTCALHWVDPLAWIAARRLRVDRELAADDTVVDAGMLASSYAQELLAIAGIALPQPGARSRPSTRGGALGMVESELGARIVSILEPKRSRGPLPGGLPLLVGAIAVAATAIVACAERSDAPRPADEVRPPTATSSAALQAAADDAIARIAAEWRPRSAVVLIVDPWSGEVLANAGREGDRAVDVATLRAFAPGSTLKPIVVAAALEERAIEPTEQFDCKPRSYGERTLHDAEDSCSLDVTEILARSSNVGASRIFDRLGSERLETWLQRFGFGSAPSRTAPGAAPGLVPHVPQDASFEGAMVAIGHAMSASPLQLAGAYAVLAAGGELATPGGATPRRTRVLSATTARTVVTMLESVVTGERATGHAAQVEGVRVAGKTGTSEWTAPDGKTHTYASFVGIVPADEPRFVVLVGADVEGDGATGGKVAAPAFARIAARALGR